MGDLETVKTVVYSIKHAKFFDDALNKLIKEGWCIYYVGAAGDYLVATLYKVKKYIQYDENKEDN